MSPFRAQLPHRLRFPGLLHRPLLRWRCEEPAISPHRCLVNAQLCRNGSVRPTIADRERHSLAAFGLDRDQLDEVVKLTIGVVGPDDDNAQRRRREMEKTISRRWADLVDQWLT